MVEDPPVPTEQGDDGGAGLTTAERELWRLFLGWTESVTGAVGRDLVAHSELSVPDFEVLVRLHESPGRALGQHELAGSLGWSPSRLSHQLSRLERRDLVSRTSAGTGRRMTVALTAAGAQQFGNALAVHARAVRRHFLAGLSGDDLHAMRALLLERIRPAEPG